MKERPYFEYLKSLTSGMEIQVFKDALLRRLEMDFDDVIDLFLKDYYYFLLIDTTRVEENIRLSRTIVEKFDFNVGERFEVLLKIKS